MQRLLINLGMAALVTMTIAACSNSAPTAETKSETKPEAAKMANTGGGAKKASEPGHDESDPNHKHDDKHSHGSGNAVEVDGYHLELSSHKEGNANHVDLLFQKGEKHEPVTGAKVTAQMQLPDGSSKRLDLIYKAAEKSYSAEVADIAPGTYKVTVLSEIDGKKVNARFNLKI